MPNYNLGLCCMNIQQEKMKSYKFGRKSPLHWEGLYEVIKSVWNSQILETLQGDHPLREAHVMLKQWSIHVWLLEKKIVDVYIAP